MPDITIIMPSYNKEKYIAQALDSVFMQETSYDYQIIVADDCSTDNTVNIVKDYQQKYPNKIILLESKENLKLYKNVLRAYEITKTDYFCVLDPDDFWIDKFKIQKALDFLEKNKAYTIYATNTVMQMPDGTRKGLIVNNINKIVDSTFEDFLKCRAVLGCTPGSVFRNVIFKDGIPEKMKCLPSESARQSFRGDTFRSIIHIYCGKVHFVPEIDAVYRITNEGLWQGISELEQNITNANIFKDLWLYFDKKYPELLAISLKFSLKLKESISKGCAGIEESKRFKLFNAYLDLKSLYAQNKMALDTVLYKNIKLKYKIMRKVYFYLDKKLSKKELIQ